MQKYILWLFFLLITACNVGTNYVRPRVAVPINYKETPKHWKIAQPNDQKDRGRWWTIFRDPHLNLLEERLHCANQNIAVARAQYEQARALVAEAAASYFPTMSAALSLTRQKQAGQSASFESTSADGSNSGEATTSSQISTTKSLNIDASWEPDLWGSVRRSVEASRAGAESSHAQLASVRLLAEATLAEDYFQLRALDSDQQILNDTVSEYQKTLKLTKNRYASGVVMRSDVIQAQTQLDTARSNAINNKIARAQFEHAIAVLVGTPASAFSIAPIPLPLHMNPPQIPVGVPSTLLERRPDIAEAERNAAEANAQIGVAVAAYFPTLTLTGTTNTNNNWLSSIPDLGWILGAQLAETILDGGARSATIHAASANYRAMAATYRQTVLAAFQDVEDNLASIRILSQQYIVQNNAARDARYALKLMLNQYKSGTVPYTDVITAQTTAYTALKNAADIQGQRMVATVGLIKALGGGWNC